MMMQEIHSYSVPVFLAGAAIIAALLLKAGLRRLKIPGLVGFILLGFGLRLADTQWQILLPAVVQIFAFLGQVGIVILLFRIGLESNIHGLIQQLPRAGWIWMGNVALSCLAVFAAARWVLSLTTVQSLFAAVSLAATSVGVSVAVWRQHNAMKTENGKLLLDTAELDDISSIALMAVLFAVAPVFRNGSGLEAAWTDILRTGGWFLVKLIVFGVGCYLFSRFVEKRLTRFFEKVGHPETTMLLVAGTGMVVAALAGRLGFSLAIGALFAGLSFSRDPDAVKLDTSFNPLYELFVPFFFIHIGLQIEPGALQQGLVIGIILLSVATVAKWLGAALPVLAKSSGRSAMLIGLSMVPRAEIAMIVVQQGQEQGAWAVPPPLFAGVVFICAVTCLLVPVLMNRLLAHEPQTT